MTDVSLSNLWIFGYYFFTALYYFCNSLTSIRSSWHAAILFPLTGDWKVNELQGDQYCRDLIAPLL
jgi:hypothetical protein